MLASILAAAFTFTATATGVDKGTSIEFMFAARGTDRDYESMFVIDEPVSEFCRRLESAGLPRGRPVDQDKCRLWPSGCSITFQPALSTFVKGTPLVDAPFVYTGGTRDAKGRCEADDEMPMALVANYTLPQAPFVHDGIFEQGAAYGRFTAVETLKKGQKVEFTISWDEKTLPKQMDLVAKSGHLPELIKALRQAADAGEIDVCVAFDGDLSVSEATAVANALSSIDSSRVKINGCSNIFYRAFQPLVKWLDRKERLQQPFELSLYPDGSEKLLFIDEDWSVPGDDPKLTPQEITVQQAVSKVKTDTCFIFVDPSEKVSRVLTAMKRLNGTKVKNWYVFAR